MIELMASTRSKEYPVFMSTGVIDRLGTIWDSLGHAGKVVIITDSNVGKLYLERAQSSFADAGFGVSAIEVEAGEDAKSLERAARLYSELYRRQTRRRDAVCALGGGVVGDLAGFIASTYMRGVRLIQVPTTLLSQVDSSIGGKTGVNIAEAKNYVGSFYQPDAVFCDPGTLKTLPQDQLVEGMAEVVKYALLSGDDFFETLENSRERLMALDMAVLEPVVRRCIEYKLAVVSEDERDYGRRAVLNLGHTVGHGIESAGNYKLYSHGQAVALGLMAAIRLSADRFRLSGQYAERLEQLLKALGLPTTFKGADPQAVLAAMAGDKKADDFSANLVLLKSLGDPVINCNVDAGLLQREVERLVA